MVKTVLAAITATVLLASSAAPLRQYSYRGGYGYGAWHGGWWNGGAGAALVSVLGWVPWRGLDGPLLHGTVLRSTRIWLCPRSSRTHHLVLVCSIPAILSICAELPDCMAANSTMRPEWSGRVGQQTDFIPGG